MKITTKVSAVISFMLLVAGDVLVGRQRCGAGDVGLDAGRRRCARRRCRGRPRRTRWPASRPGCRPDRPARRRLCRRRSASPPRSAGRPRSPGHARRVWCPPRACRSARRRYLWASSPSGCSPSSTIIAELSESNSWKSLPICFIAIIDGACCGAIDTECICPTVSSCGTMTLRMAMTTTQPTISGTDSRRIHLAIPAPCRALSTGITAVGASFMGALMRTSPSRRSVRSRRWSCSRP